MAANSQFTPRQVLEAGRRAEQDGQRDYAVQFYQHVLLQHPAAPEAAEAADALRRLEGYDRAGVRDPRQPDVASQPAAVQRPLPLPPSYPAQGYSQQANGAAARHTASAAPYPTAPVRPTFEVDPPTQPTQVPQLRTHRNGHDASLQRQPSRRAKEKARSGHAHEDGEAHAEARPRAASGARKSYRLGRFLATMLGLFGLVGVIAGMVSLGANLVLWVTRTPNSLLSMLASSPAVAGVLIAGACVLILISQMAKATFDTASHRAIAEMDD